MNLCVTHNQQYDSKAGEFCPQCEDRCLTVQEVAEHFGVSETVVRRKFRNVSGSLQMGHAGRRNGKRRRICMRILYRLAKHVFLQTQMSI